MERREFLKTSAVLGATSTVAAAAAGTPLMAAIDAAPHQVTATDRGVWVDTLSKISRPVLTNLAAGTLQKNWQMEYSPTWDGRNKKCGYLEAFGRLSMGGGRFFQSAMRRVAMASLSSPRSVARHSRVAGRQDCNRAAYRARLR